MKNLLIFLPLFILTINLSAQIKEQYQAENSRNTTIVIKEGRASDQDILAQNFNLNDYRVGDVIQITTAKRTLEKKEVRSETRVSTRSTRVKRKKKKSFILFKRPLRGKRKVRKSNFRNCYRF